MCPEQFWVITMAGQNMMLTAEHWQFQHAWYTLLASRHLSVPKAHSLRAELTKCIKMPKRPASNTSKDEFKALQELKADTDITILPADKGRSTVILNTKDYESKLSTLLSHSNTYEMLQKDPTPKFKRTDRNNSTMAKGGPNPYSSQTFWLFQKKFPICMAYLGSTGRMSLYEQLSQAEEASHTMHPVCWQIFLAP